VKEEREGIKKGIKKGLKKWDEVKNKGKDKKGKR
jgi:hypothetical protein